MNGSQWDANRIRIRLELQNTS